MTQAADADHGDQVTGLRWRVSQSAEGRESCAQQRCRIDRGQLVRDGYESARLCDHHFGVSAVVMNAGVFLIPAVHKVTTTAIRAVAARAAKKSHSYPLTDGPILDAGTQFIDPPNDLMAGDARPI